MEKEYINHRWNEIFEEFKKDFIDWNEIFDMDDDQFIEYVRKLKKENRLNTERAK